MICCREPRLNNDAKVWKDEKIYFKLNQKHSGAYDFWQPPYEAQNNKSKFTFQTNVAANEFNIKCEATYRDIDVSKPVSFIDL